MQNDSNKSNGELESSSTFTFKWNVKEFTLNFEREENDIVSPELLTVYANHLLHWRMRLSKNYDREGYRNYMAVYLDYFDSLPMTATVSFAILTSRREKVFQRVTKAKFDKNLTFCGIIDFVQQSLLTDNSMYLIVNDGLVITCEISFKDSIPCTKISQAVAGVGRDLGVLTISEVKSKHDPDGLKIVPSHPVTTSLNSDLKTLSDDLEKLLENGAYSDVSFIIGEKKIRAHKNILTSRSQAFVEIFAKHEAKHSDNVNEKKRSLVGVKDVRFEVMMEIVRYIYAGKVIDMDKMAVELLMAAEKYALAGLKANCEKALIEKIRVENALDYLSLAKNFNAAKLNVKVMDFVIARLGDYVKTSKFRDLSVDIKDDLLNAVSKKNIPQ